MASYLVLTSPGAARDDVNARFIADKFSWVAFVFPAIWLLFKRQWLAGIAVAILQGVVTFTTQEPHLMLAGLLVELALRLLVALEGPAFIVRGLEAKGWTLQSVITADDLPTAELIYDHAAEAETAVIHDTWQPPSMPSAAASASGNRAAVGLFENYGER